MSILNAEIRLPTVEPIASSLRPRVISKMVRYSLWFARVAEIQAWFGCLSTYLRSWTIVRKVKRRVFDEHGQLLVMILRAMVARLGGCRLGG